MLKWVSGKFDQIRGEVLPASTVHSADPNGWFPFLNAESLLSVDHRKRALQQLWENSPFSRPVWEAFWLIPIRELAIRLQQLPAAQSGPYAREGGMLDEALDVAVCAVRLSRGWLLPPGAAPEDQAAQSSAWYTAIFWAALLHDLAGMDDIAAFHQDGTRWYPGIAAPIGPWRFRFCDSGPDTPALGALVGYRLLPEEGLRWLSHWPKAINTLLVYLSGNQPDCDVLHTAVNEARQKCGLQPLAAKEIPAPMATSSPVVTDEKKGHEGGLPPVGGKTPGESFWNWLVSSVANGVLTVNAQDSLVHVMMQHIFVQTPECFYRYLGTKKNAEIEKDNIQKDFETLHRHYSQNGKGIYIYRKYKNEKREGSFIKLFGYMIPLTLIFTNGSQPTDSIWLSPNK
ncbi:TraI domain-containing protein [Yersinia pseudotuberculosis]|uniref:TraI domain-containing protein n=1 Tax=Yersinia pseudotuberculosis TaxID=633 RepID=UPI0038B4B208